MVRRGQVGILTDLMYGSVHANQPEIRRNTHVPTILVEGRRCGRSFRFDLGFRHDAHGKCKHQNQHWVYATLDPHFLDSPGRLDLDISDVHNTVDLQFERAEVSRYKGTPPTTHVYLHQRAWTT